MMITVNRLNDSITGSVNGVNYGVKYTEAKYNEMKRLETEANNAVSIVALQEIVEQFHPFMQDGYKELVETACPNILVNEETGKFYLRTTNGVTISSRPLPQELVDRILISVEKGIDFEPIVKCWTRFLRNNYYTDKKARRFANYINKTYVDRELRARLVEKDGVSDVIATERATVYQTPITQEGLISTYKVSREVLYKFDAKTGKPAPRYEVIYDEDDGSIDNNGIPESVEDRLFEPAVQGQSCDPFYCYELGSDKGKAKHWIKVGRIHELDNWGQVNTNDDQSCVKGLHVGNLDYIAGYQNQGTVTHNTFVDPMDIGAITDDGSGALRVRRYFTHSSFAGVNRGIYHSSKFAAMTDTEWEAFREEAIKASEIKVQEAAALQAETAAI